MNVITESRQFYQLSEDSFGEGGESRIYGVEAHPSLCAKIYKKVKPEQEAKIRAMVNERFDGMVEGRRLYAWPLHLLYDLSGKFVGYLMHREEGQPLFNVMRPDKRDKVFSTPYNWTHSIAVAYHLAWIFEHAHDHGYIIGDANSANFLVRKDGSVVVIDVDSFEFTDKANITAPVWVYPPMCRPNFRAEICPATTIPRRATILPWRSICLNFWWVRIRSRRRSRPPISSRFLIAMQRTISCTASALGFAKRPM